MGTCVHTAMVAHVWVCIHAPPPIPLGLRKPDEGLNLTVEGCTTGAERTAADAQGGRVRSDWTVTAGVFSGELRVSICRVPRELCAVSQHQSQRKLWME